MRRVDPYWFDGVIKGCRKALRSKKPFRLSLPSFQEYLGREFAFVKGDVAGRRLIFTYLDASSAAYGAQMSLAPPTPAVLGSERDIHTSRHRILDANTFQPRPSTSSDRLSQAQPSPTRIPPPFLRPGDTLYYPGSLIASRAMASPLPVTSMASRNSYCVLNASWLQSRRIQQFYFCPFCGMRFDRLQLWRNHVPWDQPARCRVRHVYPGARPLTIHEDAPHRSGIEEPRLSDRFGSSYPRASSISNIVGLRQIVNFSERSGPRGQRIQARHI